MEKDKDNKINQYLTHTPLKYGKKFYFGEFLAENFIKMVALVSIVSILAIFYYVFQESTYAFKPVKVEKPQVVSQNSVIGDDENLEQETYGAESSQSEDTELKQETYGKKSTEKEESLEQETYGIATSEDTNSEDTNSEVETAIAESDSETEAVYDSEENTNALNPVTFEKLILSNDYVDNKPAYIWQPISDVPKYSFIPLFIGALKVTLIGLLFAAPLAILAAIFTVAFAPKWLKEIIKPAIEVLAGFPSVVIGFFCLMTLATLIQSIFDTTYRLNSFVGGLGMAMAVIPIIYTITEDALSAVPQYMRAASLALGASRWQTAWKVLLPAAAPGVFAALILGFGRAFGETMIALMATGNAALVSGDVFESVRTMAATIGSEMAEVEFQGIHYGVLFLIGAVLFTITFSLNALAEFYVRKKLMKKFQGQ
jgi:phosphate transport system permease protein